jgi:hypothetical protein
VCGPDGSPLTLNSLPPPGTTRWVIRRKAEVVAAVRGGLLSLEQACTQYLITVDEFLSWQSSVDRHGLPGLRITHMQQYRGRLNAPGAVGAPCIQDKPGSARSGQELPDLIAKAKTGEKPHQNQTRGAPQADNREIAGDVGRFAAEPSERSSIAPLNLMNRSGDTA